jgi:hypothetical protein
LARPSHAGSSAWETIGEAALVIYSPKLLIGGSLIGLAGAYFFPDDVVRYPRLADPDHFVSFQGTVVQTIPNGNEFVLRVNVPAEEEGAWSRTYWVAYRATTAGRGGTGPTNAPESVSYRARITSASLAPPLEGNPIFVQGEFMGLRSAREILPRTGHDCGDRCDGDRGAVLQVFRDEVHELLARVFNPGEFAQEPYVIACGIRDAHSNIRTAPRACAEIADYNEAILLNPRDTIAYEYRGEAHLRNGNYGSAIKDYTEAIQLGARHQGDKVFLYIRRGEAYYGNGDDDSAVVDCTEAIRLDPKLWTGYNCRSKSYFRKGDFDRSSTDATEAHALEGAVEYNSRPNNYYRNGDYDHAISEYTEAIRLDPNDAAKYNSRAKAYYGKG